MSELTRILHVEDDMDIAQIAQMALELIGGFTIVQVDSGEKAIEIVSEFDPQLILSDVQMPGLTGPETLQEIRKIEKYKEVPAIFLTARLTDGCAGIRNHPMDLAIIGKPFDPMNLADQIRDHWDKVGSAAA